MWPWNLEYHFFGNVYHAWKLWPDPTIRLFNWASLIAIICISKKRWKKQELREILKNRGILAGYFLGWGLYMLSPILLPEDPYLDERVLDPSQAFFLSVAHFILIRRAWFCPRFNVLIYTVLKMCGVFAFNEMQWLLSLTSNSKKMSK